VKKLIPSVIVLKIRNDMSPLFGGGRAVHDRRSFILRTTRTLQVVAG